jgi:adenylyltransferase/sulfurtransferase
VPGSDEVPLDALLANPRAAGPGPLVLICARGVRARRAADALLAVGIDASVLDGGLAAWPELVTRNTTVVDART